MKIPPSCWFLLKIKTEMKDKMYVLLIDSFTPIFEQLICKSSYVKAHVYKSFLLQFKYIFNKNNAMFVISIQIFFFVSKSVISFADFCDYIPLMYQKKEKRILIEIYKY